MSKLNWVAKGFGIILLWATGAVALPAQTLTTLFKFDGTDGGEPRGGLIQATDGNVYGTANGGGVSSNSACTAYEFKGCGTVFKITPGGTVTTVYNFCSQTNCIDGYIPSGPLVQGADGNFYGATIFGGTNQTECDGFSCGTVFKVTPSGTLTTLHSFSGAPEGYGPMGALAQAADGKFYGVTTYGGAYNTQACAAPYGCGTVFTITPGGALTTLHSFHFTDGQFPEAALIQGADGNFYGTTYYGGADNACHGECGTVFKITPSGTLISLHSFDGTDGTEPLEALVQDSNGDFYGTTLYGGVEGNGTIFKISSSGALTTLHSFAGYPTDGSNSQAALVQGTDGDLYGTTFEGGANSCGSYEYGCGTAFKVSPSGTVTILYSFNTNAHGYTPIGALLQSTDGDFYGTTYFGGSRTSPCGDGGCGTVFTLSVGLKPFVETQPTSGVVGAAVRILGSNLTGATSVTFNGTAAVFTVVSQTLITSTVPTGATTGTVEVVRPNGKGLSNVPFTVLP
jgi:uncharacterized repeat protein (TIGR03803 family)